MGMDIPSVFCCFHNITFAEKNHNFVMCKIRQLVPFGTGSLSLYISLVWFYMSYSDQNSPKNIL